MSYASNIESKLPLFLDKRSDLNTDFPNAAYAGRCSHSTMAMALELLLSGPPWRIDLQLTFPMQQSPDAGYTAGTTAPENQYIRRLENQVIKDCEEVQKELGIGYLKIFLSNWHVLKSSSDHEPFSASSSLSAAVLAQYPSAFRTCI
jgi:hypothetical protein